MRERTKTSAVPWAAALRSGCTHYASFDAPGHPHPHVFKATIDGTEREVRWFDPMNPPRPA